MNRKFVQVRTGITRINILYICGSPHAPFKHLITLLYMIIYRVNNRERINKIPTLHFTLIVLLILFNLNRLLSHNEGHSFDVSAATAASALATAASALVSASPPDGLSALKHRGNRASTRSRCSNTELLAMFSRILWARTADLAVISVTCVARRNTSMNTWRE